MRSGKNEILKSNNINLLLMIHNSLLNDLDKLIDNSDENVYTYDKVGKYCEFIVSSFIKIGFKSIIVHGNTKRMLNVFSSKKLNNFNKKLYVFDDGLNNKGFNADSGKIFTDNKIPLLCNIILNMNKEWVENGDLENIKEYFSNVVKDGWGKYLKITKYKTYSIDYSFSIYCDLCPNCNIEIHLNNK